MLVYLYTIVGDGVSGLLQCIHTTQYYVTIKENRLTT